MQNQEVSQSRWSGSVLGLLGATLVMALISGLTLGIGVPWAVAYYIRYIEEHMVLGGHRLTFTGTGGQLFGNWIKWFLLTIVTLGIYSFWIPNKMWIWITKHTDIS